MVTFQKNETVFDIDETNRILAVATADKPHFTGPSEGGVTVWQLENFEKVGEEEIGNTMDVRFNADSTKIIAVKDSGEVYKISLE